MTISTYAELTTAIQTWLDRSDLSANAADFVTLGQSRLNRVLPLRMQHVVGSLTGTQGSASITLPTGFAEPFDLFLTTFGVKTRLTPQVYGTFEQGTTNGVPSAWSIQQGTIALDCPCDQAHTFDFHYRKNLDIATDSTNWLLTNHPDVYLLSGLVEAAFFAENFDFQQMCQQRLDLAIAELAEKEARSKAVAVLTVDPALSAGGGFNINAG